MEPISQFWISQFRVRLSHGQGPCKWDSSPISTGLISPLNETELNEQALLKHFILPTHPPIFFFLPNNLSNLRECTPWAYSAKVKCQHLSLSCRAHSSASVNVHSHLRLEWDCLQIPPPIQRWVIDEKNKEKKLLIFHFYGFSLFYRRKVCMCLVNVLWL